MVMRRHHDTRFPTSALGSLWARLGSFGGEICRYGGASLLCLTPNEKTRPQRSPPIGRS
jgi:hypothetical protein